MKESTSAVLLTLYTLVAQHGPVDREHLTVHLARQPLADLLDKYGKAVTPTTQWVSKSLYYLQSVGRVRRQARKHGPVAWVAVPQAELDAAPPVGSAATAAAPARPRRQAHRPAAPQATGPVALPRRVDMFGPPYSPPKVAMRPGATDHTRHPSLHMGQRYAWRSGMATPG